MPSLDSRLAKLERFSKSLNSVFVVYVDPPEDVEVDNRTVFRSVEDIPAEFHKKHGRFAIFSGLGPDCI